MEVINAPTISAAVVDFLDGPAAPEPPARAANLELFGHLHKRQIEGVVEKLPHEWALAALARSHSSGAMFAQTLQIGEFELAVKAGKLTSFENMPSFKRYVGAVDTPDPEGFVQNDAKSYLKGGDPVQDGVEVRLPCAFPLCALL